MAAKTQTELQTVERKHITTHELDALIAATAGNRWADRDATMIRFAFRHGMRVSELVALTWDAIDWQRKVVTIMRRKQRTTTGVRANEHPLDKDELKALRRLQAAYGDESAYVFASERRGADGRFQGLTRDGFAKTMARLADKAGVAVSNPHALRHGKGREMADRGVDAFAIRDALGHRNVATSNQYVAASPERLRDVL